MGESKSLVNHVKLNGSYEHSHLKLGDTIQGAGYVGCGSKTTQHIRSFKRTEHSGMKLVNDPFGDLTLHLIDI